MRRDGQAFALLVVIGVASVVFRLGPLESSTERLQETDVIACDGSTMHLDAAKAELLRLHNEKRAENGVTPLCAQRQLMIAAQAHSEDMLERGFYAHDTPEGVGLVQRTQAASYPSGFVAENIHNRDLASYGDEPSAEDLEQVVEDWMESEGHRKNLLNPELHEVGFGVATGTYKQELGTAGLYTVDFGTPRQGESQP